MIKVVGMSLCSTAVITEEGRATEGRAGRGGGEQGVEQAESLFQAAARCPPLVWRFTMILARRRSELSDLVYGT